MSYLLGGALEAGALDMSEAGGVEALMSDAGAEAGGAVVVVVVSVAVDVVVSVSFFLQPPTASALAATATTSAVFQSIFMPSSYGVAPLAGRLAHG